jgi:hypothetical protein
METNKPSIFDLYGRKDKEPKYSIKEETPLKKEIRETDMKDPKGRSISFKYFIKRLEVVEDERGSWGDYTFRNGPGTYYTVTTTKLRDGKVFGATFVTKYVPSEEEALKIGEDYLKKNTKKLSTFKEFYKESSDTGEVYPKNSLSVNKELRRLGIPVKLVSGGSYYYWLDLNGDIIEGTDSVLVYRASHLRMDRWVEEAQEAAKVLENNKNS